MKAIMSEVSASATSTLTVDVVVIIVIIIIIDLLLRRFCDGQSGADL